MATVSINERRISQIIHQCTKSHIVVIPRNIISELKSLLDEHVILIDFCFDALFKKLADKHAQTRLLSLCLINCIFRKFKHFRELTVIQFELLCDLTLPVNPQKPLPAPYKTAKYLSEQSIEFIEEWADDFGARHFGLKVGYERLKNVHHICFPNKRFYEREQQKLNQFKRIQQIKEALQPFIEIIEKFKQKYPKMIDFLQKFETKIAQITPSFDQMLDSALKEQQPRFIGFSDDESESESDGVSHSGDLNLELPSFVRNNFADDNSDLFEEECMNDFDFSSNCHRYGLQKGYSLKITINTDIDSYLKNKQAKDQNAKKLLKELSTYRYLIETKLNIQIKEWRSIVINANVDAIANTDKELIFAKHRMDILRKLDQINIRISAIMDRCNALNIEAKNKQKHRKRKEKKIKINKPKLAATYIDVKASLTSSNPLKIKQTHHGKLIKKKRILIKKLVPKRKSSTMIKFGVGSKFRSK